MIPTTTMETVVSMSGRWLIANRSYGSVRKKSNHNADDKLAKTPQKRLLTTATATITHEEECGGGVGERAPEGNQDQRQGEWAYEGGKQGQLPAMSLQRLHLGPPLTFTIVPVESGHHVRHEVATSTATKAAYPTMISQPARFPSPRAK